MRVRVCVCRDLYTCTACVCVCVYGFTHPPPPTPAHSFKDTEKEFSDLQYELLEVQKELSWQRAHPPKSTIETDLFVPTMTGFVEATKGEFNALQALITEMKLQYDETLQYFGEDPSDPGCPSTDEFFGIFSTFLVSFSVS